VYKDAEVPIPTDIFPPREGKPGYLNKTQAWAKGPNGTIVAGKGGETVGDEVGKKKGTFENWVRQVNECVPSVDEGVGAMIEALKQSGQYENTLIVYTADQGFAMGEHGMRIKLAPYDAAYRSPLIVAMPAKFPAGKTCMIPVNGSDLVATFLSITGVSVPWKLHGHDLTPLLMNVEAEWPHACMYEHTGDHYGSDVAAVMNTDAKQATYHQVPWYTAIMRDGWKLIVYLKPGVGDELYDLRKDPEELRNVINEAGNVQRVSKLREMLKAELARTEAGFEVR
jgi:arylsulfatase A-like enzyme